MWGIGGYPKNRCACVSCSVPTVARRLDTSSKHQFPLPMIKKPWGAEGLFLACDKLPPEASRLPIIKPRRDEVSFPYWCHPVSSASSFRPHRAIPIIHCGPGGLTPLLPFILPTRPKIPYCYIQTKLSDGGHYFRSAHG
jgi:hypothetical protein